MALDHHGQSELMTHILVTGNYFFTTIFTAESVLKIIALTPSKFLRNGWNVFDLIIVSVSLIELSLANVKGLSVLRSFRLVSNYHYLTVLTALFPNIMFFMVISQILTLSSNLTWQT